METSRNDSTCQDLARVVRQARTPSKVAYDRWTIEQFDDVFRHQTPRLGLWLDTSVQTPTETVNEIVTRGWTEARIGAH